MLKAFLLLSVCVLLFSIVSSKLPRHFFAHKGVMYWFDLNKIPEYKQAILSAHNKVRSAVGVPALRWNSQAADLALDWAYGCNWGHSDRSNWGENIAYSSAYYRSNQKNPNRVVTDKEMLEAITGDIRRWADEKKNYSYSSNSCRGVCGHYTQIVWKKTTSVGCGVVQCDNLSPGWSNLYLVCNYSPQGNMNNARPY